MDLDKRARMTLAATYTADLYESESVHVSNEENVTIEQVKDYLDDVLEEIEATRNKSNKAEKKE